MLLFKVKMNVSLTCYIWLLLAQNQRGKRWIQKKKKGGGEMVYSTDVVDQKLFQVSKSHWENKN